MDHRKDRATLDFVSLPILLPNELFDGFYHVAPAHFGHMCRGGLRNLWDQVHDRDPRHYQHPMLEIPSWQDSCVPLSLFGDGVAYTKGGHNLHCLCWSSLLTRGWSWKSCYLLAVMPKLSCATIARHEIDTMHEVWRYIAHGFTALALGKHPSTDPFGHPWPDGSYQSHLAGRVIADGKYRGTVWTIACDQDYAANAYGAKHFNSLTPCHHCDATRDDDSPTNVRNFALSAGWRDTFRSPADKGVSCHPIWSIDGIGAHMYMFDWMHCWDLGVLPELYGSTLHDILDVTGPFRRHRRFERRLELLWVELQKHYQAVDAHKRLANLTAGMVGQSSEVFPALHCKANEARHLLKPMLSIVKEFFDGTTHVQHILRAYELADEIQDIVVQTPGFFFDRPTSRKLYDLTNEFVLQYNMLTHSSIERQNLRYNPISKIHTIIHIAF